MTPNKELIYQKALEEITLGKGAFSPDQLKHAHNTIEEAREIARSALLLQFDESWGEDYKESDDPFGDLT